MNSAEKRFLYNVTSLSTLVIPKLHRVVCGLIVFMVLAAGLILYFTPWIQTAYGTGAVDSLDPKDRIQAISALVGGQIKTWHVREGMQVKAGDPIVTLIDVDAERLDKLQSQLNAANQRHQANYQDMGSHLRDLWSLSIHSDSGERCPSSEQSRSGVTLYQSM